MKQFISAGTTGAGALVYLIFASAEPQPSIIGDVERESEEVEKDIHGDDKYVKDPLRGERKVWDRSEHHRTASTHVVPTANQGC